MAQGHMTQFMRNHAGHFIGGDLSGFVFVEESTCDEDAPVGVVMWGIELFWTDECGGAI